MPLTALVSNVRVASLVRPVVVKHLKCSIFVFGDTDLLQIRNEFGELAPRVYTMSLGSALVLAPVVLPASLGSVSRVQSVYAPSGAALATVSAATAA